MLKLRLQMNQLAMKILRHITTIMNLALVKVILIEGQKILLQDLGALKLKVMLKNHWNLQLRKFYLLNLRKEFLNLGV